MRSARLESPKVLNLDRFTVNWPSPVSTFFQPLAERALALSEFNNLFGRVERLPYRDFCSGLLDELQVWPDLDNRDVEKVPKEGPLVVVANHPFGGVDGIILTSLLLEIRLDFKLMVNHVVRGMPQIRELTFAVDPFETASSRQNSLGGLRAAVKWLRAGGAMGIFPAGEVSQFYLRQRRIGDRSWSGHIARLIRRTNATVVPVYFHGANSPLFQIAGLLNANLRTALLPREMLKRRGKSCRVVIGAPIAAAEIVDRLEDDEAADYLRCRTYALRSRRASRKPSALAAFRRRRAEQSLAASVAPEALAGDIAKLSTDACLCRQSDFDVFLAASDQLPNVLPEIGRLRECTFRSVGEGCGKEADLDDYDRWYRHLFVWNRERREVVGAYRLGLTDEILPRFGLAGLYTHSLSELHQALFERTGPAIELGRSFIRSEYQRSFLPLMLLWKAIGGFVAERPSYTHFFGPVSISSRYSLISRAVIQAYFSQPPHQSPLAGLVRPRRPFKVSNTVRLEANKLARMAGTLGALNEVVASSEPDGKGVPILLQQYVKLGATALGFNVDPAFHDCLDCLAIFDIRQAETRTLNRYLGKQQAERLRAEYRRRASRGDEPRTAAIPSA